MLAFGNSNKKNEKSKYYCKLVINLPCIPRGWLRNSCRKLNDFTWTWGESSGTNCRQKNQFSWDDVTDKFYTPAPLINAEFSEFYFYISHNTPCLPPPSPSSQKKNCITIVFNSLRTVIPRRNWKQTLCKLLGRRVKQAVQMVNSHFIHVVENRLAG